MKAETNFKKGSRRAGSPYFLKIKSLILSALILTGIMTTLQAQDVQYSNPSWWFGGAVGANFNFYRGSTQQLNLDLTVPSAFHKGGGVGLYLAPLMEFHKPDSRLGFMFQVGYDSRRGKFEQIVTPCNCPADLTAKLTYLVLEPSLRLAPFKSDFYLYAGPRFAFNSGKSFKYELSPNPAYPDQQAEVVKGDFSKVYKSMMTLQFGAGYDIELSSKDNQKKAVMSPFVSVHPYFNQDPRSIETWNLTTVRVGVAFKFGRGEKINAPVKVIPVAVVPVVDVKFSVNSPGNIPSSRRMRETFPVRNYVFFNLRSSEIPDRYVLLSKDQVKNFKEDQLEVFKPKKLSGRSDRQMIVYYNILNILGDRLGKNPSANVTLTGSSMEGKDDGLAMAESVKKYLVNVFGIDALRITTAGRVKPIIPSEQPGGTKELDLLREGDRRVSITSESPALLMEFQSGEYAPLKPVEFLGIQEAPLDSYVTFNAAGARDAFSSWSVEVRDEKGALQNFGPYSQERVSIPGKSILVVGPSCFF